MRVSTYSILIVYELEIEVNKDSDTAQRDCTQDCRSSHNFLKTRLTGLSFQYFCNIVSVALYLIPSLLLVCVSKKKLNKTNTTKIPDNSTAGH